MDLYNNYNGENINENNTGGFADDQLLLHAVLASIFEQVIPLIASSKTSKNAWDKLTQLYANKTHSQVLTLKEHLTLMHHDPHPVSVFLHVVKAILD
ncbi:hypothetical protein SADUNF_Sadunf16G0121900 [Salix dunnii]|uniref:Uncharacterized protein n=1 Tax=Salix dunnii TaxID=1413687 RepID=A0A835J9H6_9ROSI|nr:hypothetical protein SADUNF_Sadunf16G0121900 [Salix dunnii]